MSKTKLFKGTLYNCEDIDLDTFTRCDNNISILSMSVPDHISTGSILKQKDLKTIWFNFLRNGKILVRRHSTDSEFSAKEVITPEEN
jgi:hypothetical protein